jgi:quercetin dioxygenase-like cupin family protein
MLLDYNQIPKVKIWEGIEGAIHHSESITLAHITIQEGVVLPEHHHIHEQWSNVISGSFEFTIGKETYTLSAGMSVFIPSNVPHSGRCLSTCKIIDVFNPPREDWKSLK